MNETIQKAWDAAVALVTPKSVAEPVVETPAAPARGADGKFAPKEPATEPVAPQSQGDEPAEETTATEKPLSAKAVKERTKALTALQRARIPESSRKRLSESELIAWGLEWAEIQAEEDRRRREAKGPSKDPVPDKASGSPGEEADPGEETDEVQESGTRMAEMQRDILAVQARTELGEDFPGLKDAATWKKVRAHALEAWLESDAYDNFEDHFEGACAAIRDAATALGVSRAASKVTSSVRDASQPHGSRPGDRFAAYKGMSPHDLTMRLLGEGKNPHEVRRIVEEVHAAR